MDIRTIKKLIDLITKDADIGEIEVKEGDKSIRVSRSSRSLSAAVPASMVYSPPAPVQMPATENKVSTHTSSTPAVTGHTVNSPIVGTVYLAREPGAEPFVELGKRVKAGDIICLIEAMKMFNQIEADKSGVISARLVENEQPVEYDQPLFIIEEA